MMPREAREASTVTAAETQPERVIHFIDSLAIGGRQILLLTVVKEAMRQDGREHRVASLFGDGPVGDRFRELGVPVDIFDLRPQLKRRAYRTAVGELRRYLKGHRPDIVEGHLTYSRLIGLFAAWRAGVPVRLAFEPGDLYLSSWKFRIANFVGQFWAHRFVPCSHALAEWDHRTHGILRRRMTVIHNCVDLERFDPARFARQRAPFDRPECDTLFCAIGTLGTGVNKRVDVILRAVGEARKSGADVGLMVVGDGPLRSELERLADELGIASHVRFLGTRTDTPEILAACDALCHATPFEPFGIVAIEAMAMARPAIVPDAGGIREAVEPGRTGAVYPPLDVHALASEMARLHRKPAERARMGQAGREAAERRFAPDVYVTQLWRLLDDIRQAGHP